MSNMSIDLDNSPMQRLLNQVVIYEGLPVRRRDAMTLVGRFEQCWTAVGDVACDRGSAAPPGTIPYKLHAAFEEICRRKAADQLRFTEIDLPGRLVYDPAHER